MSDDDRIEETDVSGLNRRCIVSRSVLPTSRMIRFVIDPEGKLTPDLARRLPGRGIWLSARRDVVNTAVAGSLFAKAARCKVVVPEGLSDLIESLLVRRCLDTLGMARRAGQCVSGFEKVCDALRTKRIGVLLTAFGAGADGVAKIRAKAPDIPVLSVLSSEEMGGVFGRFPCIHVAVVSGRLAQSIQNEAVRLSGFRCLETTPRTVQKKTSGNGVRKDGCVCEQSQKFESKATI